MDSLRIAADYASTICTIITFLAIVCKPIRNKLLGIEAIQNGLKCLLRAEIEKIYYANLDNKTLREYEYVTLCFCYEAYIALNGNSFVERIFLEMKGWEIVK